MSGAMFPADHPDCHDEERLEGLEACGDCGATTFEACSCPIGTCSFEGCSVPLFDDEEPPFCHRHEPGPLPWSNDCGTCGGSGGGEDRALHCRTCNGTGRRAR